MLFLIVSSGNTGTCQKNNLKFKYLTPDDGLSSSQILSFLQDHNGYMWIGTYNGLNRYDGKNFVIYKNDPTNPSSIQCDHIRVIFEDQNNRLFIGTNCGLSYYDPNYNHFVNLMTLESSPFYEMETSVYDITEDDNGNLWISTDGGLVHFDQTNAINTIYSHDPNQPNSIRDNLVLNTFTDSKGRTWVSTQGGLDLFLPETQSFKHITSVTEPDDNISENAFLQIAEDHQGNIWFGSYNGLYCLDNSSSENDDLFCYRNNPKDPNSISGNHLLSVFVDSQNKLWIGAENDGLYLFNREKKNFTHFLSDDYDPESLNNESIQTIDMDNSGNLWVGTFGGGINILPKNSDAIIRFKNQKGAKRSLSNNVVSAIHEDSKENVWIATDGGGLNLFNKNTGRFTRFNKNNSNFSSDVILSIKEDKNHNLWMGTWNGGIIKFKPETSISKTYTITNSNIPGNSIFSVELGDDNDLWLGSYRSGLIHFDINTNQFTSFNPDNSNILDRYIFVVRKDNKGQLYLGTASGISIFSPENNTFTNYPVGKNALNSPSHGFVYDILIQNDTCVWIGTQSGLNRFNPETEIFTKYYEKDGLPNSVIKGLVFDETGTLWITTANGVCKFDYKNKEYKNKEYEIFTKDDGLQGNEFNRKSTMLSSKGELFLGGMNGFNIVSPEKINKNTTIPEVVLTGLEIFNKPVVPNAPNSPLTTDISETTKITLSYKHTVLTFRFAVMDFTIPEKNQYAYMLENFDSDWTYSKNRSEATYTNLDPGKYVLRVKGSNNDEIWNEDGTSLEIEILPPWWKTLLFRLILVFIISGLVVAVFYIRTASLRNQKKELAKKVAERTFDLNEKNALLTKQSDILVKTNAQLVENQETIKNQSEELRVIAENLEETNERLTSINATKDKLFSIIAHDLKNPFNIILGYSELLIENFNEWDNQEKLNALSHLQTSSQNAFNLLENLLHWSRSQRETIEFKPSKINVKNLINEIFDEVIAIANEKKIKLQNLCIDEDLEVYADLNMLTLIYRNLLTNAIKFSHSGSTVFLNMEDHDEEFVRCSVKDEGVGMEKGKIESLFDLANTSSAKGTNGENGTGLGLLLCKEFVTRHNGKIWIESKVNEGTTFYFTIPK